MTRFSKRTLLALTIPAVLVLFGLAGAPRGDRDPVEGDGRFSACGCAHACSPASYQGCGCGAISCFPGGERLKQLSPDPKTLRVLKELTGPAPCINGLAAESFPCRDVELESFVPLESMRAGASSGSNLWGFANLDDGREYAVFGLNSGTAVVEVTDPIHPVVVGSIPGPSSAWREVKVYQFWNPVEQRHNAYAYVVSEARTAGVQILNLSELPSRVTLAATYRGFDTAHTVTLSNADPSTGTPDGGPFRPVLYLQGARNPVAGIAALDVSDPTSPVLLGTYNRSYGHDIWTGTFADERAGACGPGRDPCEIVVNWAGDSIHILDWTDKARPEILGEFAYPGLGYAHSGWASPDRNFLFSMDELDERQSNANSRVRVIDLHDFSNPRVAAVWTGSTRAIEHNGYTRGNRFYMSHYERGLTVLDVFNPEAPREVAFFDTYPASDANNFHGAWGVYPFLPSGNILISNIDGAGGLFVLKVSDVPPPRVNPVPPGVIPRQPVLNPGARPRGGSR